VEDFLWTFITIAGALLGGSGATTAFNRSKYSKNNKNNNNPVRNNPGHKCQFVETPVSVLRQAMVDAHREVSISKEMGVTLLEKQEATNEKLNDIHLAIVTLNRKDG